MDDFYNDVDKDVCLWLNNLINCRQLHEGKVDDRSIKEIKPVELSKYRQCHFFAGIGGWSLALQLAGWPNTIPVWTGSCPCQPFSVAGNQKGKSDDRHLWPYFFNLIRECHPQYVFGEQVSNAIKLGWLDGIQADLEAEGYTVGATVLGAHSVNSPHIRQRLYWVACARSSSPRKSSGPISENSAKWQQDSTEPTGGGDACRLGYANNNRSQQRIVATSPNRHGDTTDANGSTCGGVGYSSSKRLEGESVEQLQFTEHLLSPWRNYAFVNCRDGRYRRISTEPSFYPLAHGFPKELGLSKPELRSILRFARSNRVVRLKAYGNAIVPQVAAVFIKAFMELLNIKQTMDEE